VSYLTSRSQGSGGQHVNKVETKVVLVFDLNNSTALSAEQIDVLNEVLKNRISRKGQIQIVAQKYKSQLKNKNLANQKFIDLLIQSLKPKKVRKKHKLSKAQKEKRLGDKKKQSQRKESRKKIKG